MAAVILVSPLLNYNYFTIEGCNDCGTNPGPYTMMKDDNCDNEGDGWCIAGSIIVKAGCTLYGWEVSNPS
jgi:hypothetical protein